MASKRHQIVGLNVGLTKTKGVSQACDTPLGPKRSCKYKNYVVCNIGLKEG